MLSELTLPEDDWSGWLDERARGQIRLAGDHVAALKVADPGDPRALEVWNDVALALGNAFAVCSLLSSVHPEPAVVALAEEIEVEAHAFSTDLFLDADVYARIAEADRSGLDAGALRMLDDALLTFRRSGVDRDEEVRAKVRALDERLTELGQTFSRNIRDGRRTVRVPAAALAGLPADFVEEHPVGDDGTVGISTAYPDTHPFLTYATDPDARHTVATSFFDIAWPENDAVLHDLLAARHEKATLLGYASWPDYDAEIKMIGTGDAIAAFVERITAAADEAGRAEIAVLEARAAQDGVETIDIAHWRYYQEAVKREEHGVDAQEVRRYFSFAKVHDGLLATTARLFGLEYVPVDRAEARTWHADVSTYDVVLDGTRLGRIHLDLHPREGKYNHAAQFDLQPGVADRQLPEGVLVCNFPRGLMDHRDVVTLFHEFGHLMHHTLAGRHPWVRFSGVATEWDFVEAPSQMLEEWAWSHDVLRDFATDDDGTPIPADLVDRMRAAEDFGRAFLARTQMFYAAVSYRFHLERPDDLTARMFELYDEYSLIRPIPESHFFAGFGHLGGYTSAYYTYMWSMVIAKDMFSAFDPADLFAPEVALRYRDRVLAAGGSQDAADLVEDFLG
ncbi:MAG: Peptidase, partial [Nocardioidaceae bacterium]|nr:Peptidase [Nocardioidaceae bacterium]